MGVLDQTVTQLILVKGDTSDARAELRKLRGEEKKAAAERLDELDKTNRGIDAQIAKWSKIAVGVGAAVGVFKLAQSAANAYLEDLRLESAAAGINIDRLDKATRGLVETDNLLAFAGKAQHGVWKLNQQEMELVAKGTDVLAKRMGLELQPTLEKVTESISKGQTRALKELGIEVKDKAGLMREMTAASKDWGKAGTTEGEKWIQAQKKLKDAWDDIQGAIGEIVIALSPLVSVIADIVAKLRELQDMFGGPMEFASRIMGGASLPAGAAAKIRQLQEEANGGGRRLLSSGGGATVPMGPPMSAAYASAADQALDILARAGRQAEAVRRGGGGRNYSGYGDPLAAAGSVGGGASALGGAFQNAFLYAGNQNRRFQNADAAAAQGQAAQGQLASIDQTNKAIEQFTLQMEQASRIEEMVKARRQSMLESIFGPVDQFNAYAAGFGILQNAAAAAFDAWITGSKSLGEAIKHAIAEGLRAMAIQMLMESLKHLAYAAGNAAFGNFAGAGAHLKSAALFGAGAAAAGLAAKHMGAGQAPSAGIPAGTSAGGYIGSGGGGGGPQTSNTVIYVTNDAYRMSQAEREHRISDAARRGQQKRSSNVVAHE